MHTRRTTTKRALLLALAALAAAIVTLTLAPTARAGTYMVRECAGTASGPSAGPDVQGPFGGGSYTSFNRCLESSSDFGNSTLGAGNGPGAYRAFDVFAPPGTRFSSGYVEANVGNGGGYQGYVSIGNGSNLTAHLTTETLGTWQGFNWSGQGDTTQLTAWIQCAQAACSGSAWSWARNLLFNVNDFASPSVSLGGSLTGGGWRGSGGSLSVSGHDSGSGVYILDQYINGIQVDHGVSACSTMSNGSYGTIGTRLAPCPTSPSRSNSYGAGAFQQGANQYTGCSRDFATDGNYNSSCTSSTIQVDTVAPDSVNALTLAGGEGWRTTNDFDVSWSNPAQAHAPIDGAAYRITRTGGGYDSGRQFVSGANRESLNDLDVPSPGTYELRVWARDAAGNESEASARTATLRLDPTVPPGVEARNDGWIRRNDFEYIARWDPIAPSQVGPSGLEGYAVRVTRDPSTDPCVTADDPGAGCSPEEVNNNGIGDTEMPVSAGDVSDGEWYIHVVPVTGAGIKAAAVTHTPMPVDEGDPRSSIAGVPGDWVNHDVTLRVSATDELSGMSPSASHPMDPQPRTCLQVDGGGTECEPDDAITRVVSGEGERQIRFFARDLAGNENNGQLDTNGKTNSPMGAATVRIDRSGPQLAFAGGGNADDPSLVSAPASDSLSGLAGGVIELRRQGSSSSWLELDTLLGASGLSARVPDDIEPGRYEFRASATDRAGNASSTSSRADGSAMVESLPLKEAVNLTASVEGAQAKPPKGKGNGKCKRAGRGKGKGNGKCRRATVSVTVPYGEPVRLAGHLQAESDGPLRGRELTITERMADGATPAERTHAVRTDEGGAFSIQLPAGPSRTVGVRYAGEQRYRPTSATPIDVAVRGRVLAFKAPATVPESKPIRFRGRIGAEGVDLGSGGKRIELQYEKSRGSWRTIDSGEASGNGGFKIPYPLRSDYVRRTRVRFRVLVPPERAWPYAGTATSRARRTVILP